MLYFPHSVAGGMSEATHQWQLLRGRNIAKVAYLDEAGMSSAEQEPYWVVAGVIVDLDRQWALLDAELDHIRQLLPEEKRDGFVFHAKELFNGGKHLPRSEWPIERKLPIIDRLLSIPGKFELPICWGLVDKGEFQAQLPREPTAKELMVAGYAVAFTHAAIQLELWMRERSPDEVAQITAEDRDLVRSSVRGFRGLSAAGLGAAEQD